MKTLALNLCITMSLLGCASQNSSGIEQQFAATWLNQECHSNIEQQQIWQLGKIALGNRAEEVKYKICQCASQESVKNITTEQMIGLANEQQRTQILVEMLAPTIVNCYKALTM